MAKTPDLGADWNDSVTDVGYATDMGGTIWFLWSYSHKYYYG